jgi:phosphoglycerate dehydrogenase-like enzyme
MLIIDDTHAEHYRTELSRKFPGVTFHARSTKADVGEEVAEVEAMFGIGTTRIFGEEVVSRAKRLKWIQAFTTGTDGVIGLACLPRHVVVTSGRGVHGPQVSEMALLMMLALSRDLPRMLRNQVRSTWERFFQRRIFGKTVVILGVGLIGADLALRCKAFGMRVIGVTRTRRDLPGFERMVHYGELAQAAAEADFLVVIAPYSAQTAKMVNERVFAAMKPSAYLVNVSRGGVCDEQALLQALAEKRIAGAGLDVFAVEPLPAGHPFWHDERVIVTPHMSGGSDFSPALLMPMIESNIRCFLEGRMAEMANIVRR